MNKYVLIFDKVMLRKLRKVAKNQHIKTIITRLLNKIEDEGPSAGKLLDSKLFIYEIKNKHPPLRLYFKHNILTNEIYVFEFEIKTSKKKQQKTIDKIKGKL